MLIRLLLITFIFSVGCGSKDQPSQNGQTTPTDDQNEPTEDQTYKECDQKILREYGIDLKTKSDYLKGVYRGYYCSAQPGE